LFVFFFGFSGFWGDFQGHFGEYYCMLWLYDVPMSMLALSNSLPSIHGQLATSISPFNPFLRACFFSKLQFVTL
jgi:hypothetical protein